jgi:hypothetical protein
MKAHIFICLLAYYVEWHMRKALGSLLFQDDELVRERGEHNPVAQTKPSLSAQKKKQTKRTPEGLPVHSFHTLLLELATRCKNTCQAGEGKSAIGLVKLTEPTPFQAHVFRLLDRYP